MEKQTRFYQASTSEMFGLVQQVPQSETTPFYPRSPYAAQQSGGALVRGQLPRGVRAFCLANGILFNHESQRPRRNFRDAQNHAGPGAHQAGTPGTAAFWAIWTRAATGVMQRDYVEAMWMMLQARSRTIS